MKLKVSLNTQYLIKGKLLSENTIYKATKNPKKDFKTFTILTWLSFKTTTQNIKF